MTVQELSHDHYESELFFCLVGAVGARMDLVIPELEKLLTLAGYDVLRVKVSADVIDKLYDVPDYGTN